ncbi:MAG TPA: hypothetical protein VHG08_07365, partial [Longimicrobium sp.]|nr:hypothetical protein [Longimicrobium sp.]
MTAPATTTDIAGPEVAPQPPARRAWRWVSPAVGVALFAAALLVLHHELRQVSYAEVRQSLRGLTASALFLSVLLTAANYAVLCGFDLLAFRYVGRVFSGWKVAAASFIGYAVANSVGFALISGTSVRYRFYSRWGLGAEEMSRVVVFYSGTFWLGFLVLAGFSLAVDPHPGLRAIAGPLLVRAVGWALLAAALGYVVAAALHRAPL